jgi:hypothetical protein
MKKRTILLIASAIIIIIVLILAWIYYSEIDSSNFSDSNNLTAGQKRDAIITALTGSDMGNKMLWNPGNFRIEPVALPGSGWWNGRTGYINATGRLVQVPITMYNGADWFTDRYLIYVNLSGHDVTGRESADAHNYPASIDVNIPPGSGWYHELGLINPNSMNLQIYYDNGSPIIMPEILDEENMQRALNGEEYRTINVSLTITPEQYMVNGSLHYTRSLFMLIKNNDSVNTTKIGILLLPPF